MKLYHMNLNREVPMAYGFGLEHIRYAYWSMPEIKRDCRNAAVLQGKQGINHISVVERVDGNKDIIQFCGYTVNTGLYGYMVKSDGMLERFF